MQNQRHLFDIPDDITYLNPANMSPLLRSTNCAGKAAIDQKSKPFTIKSEDFFKPLAELKNLYANLIDVDEPQRIASITSVSYGIATVTNNIVLNDGDEILIIEDQFPSNVYSWMRLAKKYNATIKTIKKPTHIANCGKIWNEAIIKNITDKTAVVTMGHIHWADGTIFNLKAIREKTKAHNSLLIIDGSQSIGALPFSVKELQPDALICAGYKWLLGAYSYGLAYYGPYFDNGIPIEENWSNRLHSDNFAGLTNYEEQYNPFANRYNVGESGNFIAIPMLIDSISHIIKWTPESIQEYCHDISKHVIQPLLNLGCKIEDFEYRAKHLFGIELPKHVEIMALKNELEIRNIFVSIRGKYIRVSCHLFNTKKDFDTLLECLTSVI